MLLLWRPALHAFVTPNRHTRSHCLCVWSSKDIGVTLRAKMATMLPTSDPLAKGGLHVFFILARGAVESTTIVRTDIFLAAKVRCCGKYEAARLKIVKREIGICYYRVSIWARIYVSKNWQCVMVLFQLQ